MGPARFYSGQAGVRIRVLPVMLLLILPNASEDLAKLARNADICL